MGQSQLCKKCENYVSPQSQSSIQPNRRQIISLQFNAPSAVVKTSKGKIEFSPGWTYEGEMVKGVREGKGKMTWPAGDYY